MADHRSSASSPQARRATPYDRASVGRQCHLLRPAQWLRLAHAPPRLSPFLDGLHVLQAVERRRDLGENPYVLRDRIRRLEGRKKSPSAAIVDSQSVKTTEKGGPAATMRARK